MTLAMKNNNVFTRCKKCCKPYTTWCMPYINLTHSKNKGVGAQQTNFIWVNITCDIILAIYGCEQEWLKKGGGGGGKEEHCPHSSAEAYFKCLWVQTRCLFKHWKMPADASRSACAFLALEDGKNRGTCRAVKPIDTPQADTMESGIWPESTYNVQLTATTAVYLF